MFNLTVDEAHTFYVGQNGCLVHNGCFDHLLKALRGRAEQFDSLVRNGIPGSKQVRIDVNSEEEAFDLYRSVLLGRGLPPLRNTTGYKPNDAEAFLLPKDMNVHWDTVSDPNTGSLVGHTGDDIFKNIPHLQIHLPGGRNGRIYITWPKK